MMIEKVMIQLGAQKLKMSGGVGGRGRPPHEYKKQRAPHDDRKIGGGTREELAMLRTQEAKAKNQLGKQRMRKAKARKPPKATKPKSHLPQRNWQCRGCKKKNREEL